MNLNAGTLRRRATIQRRTISQSSTGAATQSWSTHKTRWAELRRIGGSEFRDGERVTWEVTYELRMRYASDIAQPKDRIVVAGKTLEVTAVMQVDNKDGDAIITAVERG